MSDRSVTVTSTSFFAETSEQVRLTVLCQNGRSADEVYLRIGDNEDYSEGFFRIDDVLAAIEGSRP